MTAAQIVLDFSDEDDTLSAADLAHRYLWGAKVDELLADETVDATPGTTDDVGWTFTDHQGSVRAVARYDSATDATTVTKTIVYDAYGNVASTSGTDATTLFLYTGRLYDSNTGLQNNLNRWYDATTGRWLSTDPIGLAGDPGNLYRYCGNGPVNWVDPSGLEMILISDACPVGPVYFGGSGGDGDSIGPLPDFLHPPFQPNNDVAANLLNDLNVIQEKTKPPISGRFPTGIDTTEILPPVRVRPPYLAGIVVPPSVQFQFGPGTGGMEQVEPIMPDLTVRQPDTALYGDEALTKGVTKIGEGIYKSILDKILDDLKSSGGLGSFQGPIWVRSGRDEGGMHFRPQRREGYFGVGAEGTWGQHRWNLFIGGDADANSFLNLRRPRIDGFLAGAG